MPIEFNCPSCSTVLRTPDASAGKKARCPQCGAITDVPSSSAGPHESAPDSASAPLDGKVRSGVAEQIERSPFGEGVASEPTAKPLDAKNPYAAPSLQEPMVQHQVPRDSTVRKGLPWEQGEKSVKTFWETAKLVLGSPTEAFQLVKRDGGMVTPMLFAISGGLVGALFSAVYGSIMQMVVYGFVAANAGEGPEMAVGAGMLVFQVVLQFGMALAAGTVGVVIGLFISSAIYQVFLMMLRGANYPFEATFAVVAYVTGATSLIQVIPLCGQYVYGIVAMVYMIIGLSAIQKISGGKAAAAVLLPGLICLILVGLVIVAGVAIAINAGGVGAGGF